MTIREAVGEYLGDEAERELDSLLASDGYDEVEVPEFGEPDWASE